MSIANFIDAQALGRRFGDEIAHYDAPIAEVWIREVRGTAEIWIITDPVELDQERAVYHVAALLIDAFPEFYVDFRVLNPQILGEGSDPHDLLPVGVERVELPTV
jgi:hypothetical protein